MIDGLADGNFRLDKTEALAEVAAALRQSPLYPQALSFVPGEGNPDSEIIFIGEAPGQREDELGRPFVGPAGQFLEEMLEQIGLGRETVFITNIVKQRPPNNRDPLPDEIAAHWPFLQKQIAIINPKLIVLLGRHSLGQLLPGVGPISQVHGRPYRKRDGRIYLPLYHPAAALYNATMGQTLRSDFKKIPPILAKIKAELGQPPNKPRRREPGLAQGLID